MKRFNGFLSLILFLGIAFAQENPISTPITPEKTTPAPTPSPSTPKVETPQASTTPAPNSPTPKVKTPTAPAPAPTPAPQTNISEQQTPTEAVPQAKTPAPTPANPASTPAVSPTSKTEAPVTPTTEQAKPEQPKAEQPKAEQPKTETPQQAKKAAQAEPPKKEDQAKEEAPKDAPANSEESQGFNSSISVGVMTLNKYGTVTRLSYRPEVSLGSFGVAFDLELFFDQERGKILPYGWEFDSRQNALRSLYRKIYYVRWNHPGDAFYVRAGAIEGVTMDVGGLVTAGWGNTAKYPGSKLIGTDLQFNNWFSPVNLSLEAVTNSWQDWSRRGGVLGLKASVEPIGFLGIPLFSKLKVGATMMSDLNQFAGLSDLDDDGCPDFVDSKPSNGSVCYQTTMNNGEYPSDFLLAIGADTSAVNSIQNSVDSYDNTISSNLRNQFEKDPFTMLAVDATMPIIQTPFLSASLYSEAAKPYVDGNDPILKNVGESWGIIFPGLAGQLSILSWGLEYRMLHGVFSPAHFNANYEMERVSIQQNAAVTREQLFWINSPLDPNETRKGIFGRASLPLGQLAYASASYSYLFAKESDQSYTAMAGLGQSVLSFIPKINKLEAFYNKALVGKDRVHYNATTGLWDTPDSFFGFSRFVNYGFNLGFEMGGGMNMVVTSLNTFVREDGKLVPKSNFSVQTILSF